MRSALFLVLVLSCSAAFGQGYVPYTPGSATAVPGYGPQPYVQQPAYIQPGLPIQEWRDGLHEEFRHIDTHDIRPIRPAYEGYGYPPQQGYGYPPQQGCGYPQQGCGYPQQAYSYPQQAYPPQQQWTYPAYSPQTVCQPAYQQVCPPACQRQYCQPACQQRQYTYYPQEMCPRPTW